MYIIISAFATQGYQFLVAYNWFVIKAEVFKNGDSTKLNNVFYFLKSICQKHDVFCEQTSMSRNQNVTNDVSKDSS